VGTLFGSLRTAFTTKAKAPKGIKPDYLTDTGCQSRLARTAQDVGRSYRYALIDMES
jgi:hypothetical protein